MMWSSIGINSEGEELMEYQVTTDLDIFNVDNVPDFRNARIADV